MPGVQQHPRYRVSVPVGLVTPSGDIEVLALEDISLGGMFIRTLLPAPAGTAVRLRLPLDRDDALSLHGRVVHVIDETVSRAKARAPGMGVQFDGLSSDTARSLARFVDALVALQREDRLARDAAPTVWAVPQRHELAAVVGEAARLLACVGTKDAYGALALSPAATDEEVATRVSELALVFSPPHPDASPAEHALLEGAVRAVAALALTLLPPTIVGEPIEPALSDVFAPFLSPEPPPGSVAPRAPDPSDDVLREELTELIAEAEFLASAGRPEEAQATLLDARGLAPDHTGVQRRLASLADTMDAAHANALLDGAERLPRDQRVSRALKASRVSSSRPVLLRAMRMLASAGALNDMLAVAEHLADLLPDDELPLFAILQVNERARRWPAAARAGEALLRLRPDDLALHERVTALAAAARNEGA